MCSVSFCECESDGDSMWSVPGPGLSWWTLPWLGRLLRKTNWGEQKARGWRGWGCVKWAVPRSVPACAACALSPQRSGKKPSISSHSSHLCFSSPFLLVLPKVLSRAFLSRHFKNEERKTFPAWASDLLSSRAAKILSALSYPCIFCSMTWPNPCTSK